MLVSELSNRSGVSVASIKFYIREGLLPAGRTTSRTRADYTDAHVDRLRLIRALLDIGGLSIAAARSVIEVIDDGVVDADGAVRQALGALGPAPADRADAAFVAARREVAELVNGLGWVVEHEAPALDLLAEALRTLRSNYGMVPVDVLIPYADVAHRLAETEMAIRPPTDDRGVIVEWAVTGTVVFERVLAAWRRLAHEDLARRAAGS